jgi:ABC-type branched-subunit amino acid transport system substrate-binding protein
VEPDGAGIGPAVAAARDAKPDALAFVGFWRAAHGLAVELKARDWAVHAVASSALMYGHADPAWARDWDGWTYVDTFSEANPRFAALSRTAAAAGRTVGPGEAGAYDMGRLLAEGIARAPELTRAGIRAGLERVKALPAASGRAGTLMGFGNWDRGALKGPYLVLREWRAGRSVER